MENCIVNESVNNDFLLHSYSQGIEKITGTKDSTFNFQVPKELLEARKKTWNNLFDKYSKEMFDDIELNVDTLEPEEKDTVSEEENSCGQRIPMRKPATLVQYWINTGNPPYKVFLNENESETGSSLSEKEITSLSPVTNAVNALNASDKRKCKNDSSCSSVDTAAYILSNANITKKVDTIAIIEGANKSLKDVAIKDIGIPSNDKIGYMKTTTINRTIMHNDGNVNAAPDINFYSMSTEHMAAEICDRVAASTSVSANGIQSNVYSQSLSCEEIDKIDKSNNNKRNLGVQTIDDIASIFRRFDKTSKRLIANDKNNCVSYLNQDKVEIEKQVSENIADEIIAKETSSTAFHRKKLFTGRDSPVDLILTETHATSRLSTVRQSLHPALDLDGTIKKESFVTHKGRDKHSLSTKRNLDSNKVERKERRESDCISNKIITNSNKCINDNRIQDSTIDSSFKNLDFHNNSDKQDDLLFQKYDDTHISMRSEKFNEPNLASLNLKPVVFLEQIKPSFNQCKLSENTHFAQKENVCNNMYSTKFKKLYSCEIENPALETINSDDSTILLCQCNINASQCASSLNSCSFDLRLNDDDFSTSNAERENSKLSSLKDTDMSQNKKLHEKGLPQLSKKNHTNTITESQVSKKTNAILQNVLSNKSKIYSNLYRRNEMDNVKLLEIKIVLERLPLSSKNCTSMEMQVLNKSDAVDWHKEISNKSNTHFSNLYGTNEKNSIKLREIKVVLERLPANIRLKECNNITNTNIFLNEKKISQNTDQQTDHKSQIKKVSKILACKNEAAVQSVCNNYSLKMNSESKKNNERNSFDIDVEHGNQISNKMESDPIEPIFQHRTFRHKNRSGASQDNFSKYSILIFTSSDEDDFVRSIRPRKRSKASINDDILNKEKISLSDSKKNISSNNLRRSNGAIKKNGMDRKNNTHVISFQTKTFDTSSSDSEESNSYTSSICKTLKNFSTHNRSQYYSRADSEDIFNDSIAKKYSKKHLSSLNSSLEKRRTSNVRTKSKLINKEAKMKKRTSEESNGNISRISDTKKRASSSSLINNIQYTSVQEKTLSNTLKILEESNLDNLSKNKEIWDKSENSVIIQQGDVTSTVRKLLMFQTKSYYDSSDSSETI